MRSRKTRKRNHCAAVLAIAIFTGCSASSNSTRGTERDASEHFDWSGKNCIIVVLDALTVNHLASWGYERETTPNLDRLASRGIVFKNARCQASSTPPSAYSYFSGTYPSLMLRPLGNGMVQLPDERTTFAEVFDEAEYDTGAFSGNIFVSQKAGFGQGFDHFDQHLRHLMIGSEEIRLDEDSTIKLFDSAKSWIQARESRPWLCYLHVLRPHNPYRAPEPHGTKFTDGYDGRVDGSDAYWASVEWNPPEEDMPRLKDFYDGNLHYVDALLGEFLDALEASGDLDDTAVIITSDHGEAFMEHGYALHNVSVHEELIRVPLILVPPKRSGTAPDTLTRAVQLVDLFPTLCDLFGLTAPSGLDGISLVRMMRGEVLNPRFTFAQDADGDIMCIIDRGRKMIVAYDENDSAFKPWQFYNLRRDPEETNNLWGGLPPVGSDTLFVSAMKYIDTHFEDPSKQDGDLEEYEREVLETLGYL